MSQNFSEAELEQLLAEAEELLEQLDAEIFAYLAEEERAQLAEQTQNLAKLKAEVQQQIGKPAGAKISGYGEGMHEAIVEIAKAMKALGRYLS
ncbi:MAG: hypothetical protein ACUVRZ_00010 [Desulfobacca sp.]|uniref:hypothetical protein n=1 Tax=Desulfobacca sp. TaxID=2067990 RepID=UPI0040493154